MDLKQEQGPSLSLRATRRGFVTVTALVAAVWILGAVGAVSTANWWLAVVWAILGILLVAALVYLYRRSAPFWNRRDGAAGR
jgi:hypothetical protein